MNMSLNLNMRIAAFTVALLAFASTAQAQIVVSNTNDSGPGSLRQAITDANLACTVFASSAEGGQKSLKVLTNIVFNIASGDGPHTISPATELPPVACGMTIDGYSQNVFRGLPNSVNTDAGGNGGNNADIRIVLDGTLCTTIPPAAPCNGLVITYGSGPTVQGLSIHSFKGHGIKLAASGYAFIYGNYIGTDPGGSAKPNHGWGVYVESGQGYIGGGSAQNRNLITANGVSPTPGGGVYFAAGGYGYLNENQIGGNRDGSAGLGNNGPGVYFADAVFTTRVTRNYIRYNVGAGVVVAAGTSVAVTNGNLIHSNTGIGIDLGGDGPTANDYGNPPSLNHDIDAGPNNLLNFPDILSVVQSAGNTLVDFEMKGPPNAIIDVELFHNTNSGVRSGEQKLGLTLSFSLNADGYYRVPTPQSFTGQYNNITATASACGDGCFYTSEYSPSVAATVLAPVATFSPGSVTFPNTAPGASVLSTVTLTNTGNGLMNIFGYSVAGTGFALASSTCSTALGAGASCTFTISFSPTAPTTYTGALTVTTNAAPGTHTISLNGSATSPGVSLSTTTLAFGGVQVGTNSSLPVTVTNTGTANLVISNLQITGSTTFTAAGCAVAVAPGSSCTVNVTFSPAASTAYAGQLTIASNASTSPHTITLNGSGTAPGASLSTSLLSFGGVPVGTSSAMPVTVTNTGTANLAVTSVQVTGSATFTAAGCASAVAPGSSCTVNVTFAPAATTGYSGQLTINSNASTSPHSVSLTGSGTAPGVGLSPSPLSFGSVTVGTSSTSNITLNNPGTAPLQVSAIAVSGSVAFTVGSACVGTLAVQATCQIPVTFTPTDTNPQAATLSVQSNASGSPHTVALSGTGIAPGVSLTPSPVTFGNVPVGGSASSPLTLTNTGTAPLLISGIATTGAYFSNTTDCGSSLAAGTSCQILVTYAPLAAGPHSGQVSVITNAGAGPVVAPLSGTGAVPVLALTGTGLTFGSQTVGTASVAQTITINNTGGAPLNITAITATGDFNFTGCATPLSIAPGAGCTLSIKFVPTAVGARTGGISIASNAAGSPHAITLSGDGTPVPVPGIALAPSSADFGALVTGMSSTQVLVLSNPGTAPLAISSIGVTGVGFSQANTCPSSLSPSLTCNISVTFAPTVTGPASGQLAIVSNAAPSPLNAALTGSGLPATTAGITFSASSVAFPPQFVGTTSAPKTVTLTSSGTAPLVISQVTGSGDFAFSGCGPSTLAPNATCTFTITFRPQSVGALTGSIVVTSNASGSPHTIALSGDGGSLVAAAISLSPSAFGFDTLRVGRTATIVGRLTNTGAATLVISQIQSTGSFFSQSNNCPATLAVGGFCDVTVAYSPTTAGAHSGQLLVHSNVIPSPFVAAMSGTAVVVPPPFLSTNGPVSFGQQVTGATVRRTLVLTNTGGEALNISALAIVGSGAFGVEGGCGTIAPEASCSLTITFLPTGINTFNARLDIASNHSGGVVQVQLSGQGVALPVGDLDFSVAAVGFGNQTLGTAAPGAGQTVRLTNIGGAPVTISALRSTLPDFTVNASQCIGTLQPRAFCDLAVVFRPFRPGPLLGSLLVDSSPVQNDSVSLIGVGCRIWKPGQSIATLCSP